MSVRDALSYHRYPWRNVSDWQKRNHSKERDNNREFVSTDQRAGCTPASIIHRYSTKYIFRMKRVRIVKIIITDEQQHDYAHKETATKRSNILDACDKRSPSKDRLGISPRREKKDSIRIGNRIAKRFTKLQRRPIARGSKSHRGVWIVLVLWPKRRDRRDSLHELLTQERERPT